MNVFTMNMFNLFRKFSLHYERWRSRAEKWKSYSGFQAIPQTIDDDSFMSLTFALKQQQSYQEVSISYRGYFEGYRLLSQALTSFPLIGLIKKVVKDVGYRPNSLELMSWLATSFFNQDSIAPCTMSINLYLELAPSESLIIAEYPHVRWEGV